MMQTGSCVAQLRQPGSLRSLRIAAPSRHRLAPLRAIKWREAHGYLTSKGLRTIAPKDAAELVTSGEYALIDVRFPDDHSAAHPEGAVNVPMYQKMDAKDITPQKALKFLAYAFNGMTPTERNPGFAEQLRAAAAGKKGVIVACEAGGTLQTSANFPLGKASRSLQAAYRAMSEGLADDVLHLERGAYGWFQDQLPFKGGEYKPQLGRTPNAVPDATLQKVANSVAYEQREGDKVAEEKKKEWWKF